MHNNSSSYSENYKDSTPQRAKIHKYPPLLVQAYSMLFILNQHLCRQGKSLELRILFQYHKIKSAIENWSKAEVEAIAEISLWRVLSEKSRP